MSAFIRLTQNCENPRTKSPTKILINLKDILAIEENEEDTGSVVTIRELTVKRKPGVKFLVVKEEFDEIEKLINK